MHIIIKNCKTITHNNNFLHGIYLFFLSFDEFEDKHENFAHFSIQIFDYLNEELISLKRILVMLINNELEITDDANSNLQTESNKNEKHTCFDKLCRLVLFCLIISKNLHCLNLLLSTSCITKLMSLSSFILNIVTIDCLLI